MIKKVTLLHPNVPRSSRSFGSGVGKRHDLKGGALLIQKNFFDTYLAGPSGDRDVPRTINELSVPSTVLYFNSFLRQTLCYVHINNYLST